MKKKKVQNKKIIHYCPNSKKLLVNKESQLKKTHYSILKDNEGNPLETEFGLSTFEDWQKIIIQDQTRLFLNGDIPVSTSVILENDLVNACNIGDDVEICGILKPIIENKIFIQDKVFSTVVSARSVRILDKIKFHKWTETDWMIVKSFSNLSNCFERLSSLVAPNIFGQALVKKGLLLSLIGGEKIKKDNSSLRGQINILLVGGSSGQKEKFLNFISKFSYVTAFPTKQGFPCFPGSFFYPELLPDKRFDWKEENLLFDGKRTFCIPNIDKVSQTEKNNIKEILDHQSMFPNHEQHSSFFNSKFNLIATMEFSHTKKDFSDLIKTESHSSTTLISRFDCILFLSENDSLEQDKKISNHLFQTYIQNDTPASFPNKNSKSKYEKSFPILGGEEDLKIFRGRLSYNFFKVFVQFAKFHVFPVLTEESIEMITNSYLNWRVKENFFFPVTIRKLETITRLSVAYSKCHLQEKVFPKDVKFVNQFMKKSMDKEDQNEKSNTNFISNQKNRSFQNHNQVSKNLNQENVEKCNWFVKEGELFFNKNLIKLKKNQLRFYNFKKLFGLNVQKSFGERTLVEWSRKNLCFIFRKVVLRF